MKINGVLANNKALDEASSFDALVPGTFFQDAAICYFIAHDYKPAWVSSFGVRASVANGLTTGKSFAREAVFFRGGLNYYPAVKETADNIEAAKMKFNSGSVTLDNSDGVFDSVYSFFGNSFLIFVRDGDTVFPLYEYYIKDVKVTLKQAVFSLADRRSLLTQKIPSEKYTVEQYPYMQNPGNAEQKSKSLGNTIADAYGYCVNIPAVCIDEFLIYDGDLLKEYRTFKACRKITRLDTVMVKMTQPDSDTGSKEVWTDQTANIRSADYENGVFTMGVKYCMPPFEGYDIPEIYDVNITGVFGMAEEDCTPAKIIADILSVYAGVPYNSSRYNIPVYESELSPLARVGLYLDKEKDLFQVIETIQNGSDYSFQFITDFDKFSAKRNDDERGIIRNISKTDIVNISAVETEANADEYATVVDIGFNADFYNETSERIVRKDNRDYILYQYNTDKTYSFETLLYSRQDAANKADRLIKYFSEPRPLITNIMLNGVKWFDLHCYDIINIDLRYYAGNEKAGATVIGNFPVNIPARNVMGVENTESRSFVTADFNRTENIRPFTGLIKGKIISIEKNVKEETVKISVIKLETVSGNGNEKDLRAVDINMGETGYYERRVDDNGVYLQELRKVNSIY
jgi:hypothetical protein